MGSYAESAGVRAALLVLAAAVLLPAHHVMAAYPAMAPAPAGSTAMSPRPAANDTAMSPSYHSPPVRPVLPYVIVEGVIYCKPCRSRRYSRDMDASPLQGYIYNLHPPDLLLLLISGPGLSMEAS